MRVEELTVVVDLACEIGIVLFGRLEYDLYGSALLKRVRIMLLPDL